MKTENNYERLKQIDEATSPLPKEEFDIPTRVIPIYTDGADEPFDKVQIEAEVEIEKHGVPVIDVERPPVPEVHTDDTRYKKIPVKRKSKRSDGYIQYEDLSLEKDREMDAYAKELKIPKGKSIFIVFRKKLYELSCKIKRFALNRQRKKFLRCSRHYHEDHRLPYDVKTITLVNANDENVRDFGTKRGFRRYEDRSPSTIKMVRNNKTGVVVAISSVDSYRSTLEEKGKNIDDYEVVESQIKD